MADRFVTHSTFAIERLYAAPPERVFAAWGDPVAKNRWFAADEAGTRLTVTDHGTYLDGHDNADWREAGTREQLDRLVDELKR